MPFFQKNKKEAYELNVNQANNTNTAAINNNSNIACKDDKKQANVDNSRPNEQQTESNANASKLLKSTPSTNKNKPNIFTIFAKPHNELELNKKDSNNNNKKPNEPVSNLTLNNNGNYTNNSSAFKPMQKKTSNNPSLMSLIIDSSILNTESNKGNSSPDIFDPEPAPEDLSQLNQIMYLDDQSFMIDDDLKTDKEVADINNPRLNDLAKGNSCHTINEVPEGRLSKLNTSRASSRGSLGSDSTRTSSNPFEQASDQLSSGFADMNKAKRTNYNADSEASGSSEGVLKSGSKNALLDALMRKFNVNMDIDTNSDTTNESKEQIPKMKALAQQPTKYTGDDQKKKQSELQKKINRINNNGNNNQLSQNIISEDSVNRVDASSSFDDNPKELKLMRSTGTQMSSVSKITNYKQRIKSANITRLPQNFECKYIGKAKCKGLWGLNNIREPVNQLVRNAKRHRTLQELPDVEALFSEKGIYIVQISAPSNKNNKGEQTKVLKSGLLPISNISYAVQDNVYGKIFSCILVREKDNKTISECYSFLCSKNETARLMALSITLAFKEYGKLLQIKENEINKTIKLQSVYNDPDSFA